MRKLVIIPTYNERENVARMIDKVLSLADEFDMLFVDDGSPDGTAAIVENEMRLHPDRIFIIRRTGKLGLGTAYIAGFRWALERDYDMIFEMDCDFSHNPDDLHRLVNRLATDADVVVGSRYVRGVNDVNWPLSRLLSHISPRVTCGWLRVCPCAMLRRVSSAIVARCCKVSTSMRCGWSVTASR